MSDNSQRLAHLQRAAVRLAEEQGFTFVDLELVKEPTGRFLRIYIDKEGGIGLNELETYHKALRPQTDDIDYDYMEVSSPGADRPLKKSADFERAKGKTVDVKLFKPMDGTKQFRGELLGLKDGIITLLIAGEEKQFEQKAVALIRPFVDVEAELEAQDEQ